MSNLFSNTLFLLFALFLTPHLHAIEPQEPQQLLSSAETLVVIEKIKPYGISFGNGKREVHVFIDPYCSVSKYYLSTIFEKRERNFKKSTYYFYLYELKSKDSKEIIEVILSADDKEETLKAVMLDNDIFFDKERDVKDEVNAIAEAAQKIGVYKRPYIIIHGKVQ
ncbi:MAG: hypothetical protein WBF77_00190 [Sulfurimonadaceae bacterium]